MNKNKTDPMSHLRKDLPMEELSLHEVTKKNFSTVIKLSETLTEAQRKCVAPNVKSLAQAYLDPQKAWPRAVYLNDIPIGFVMLYLDASEEIPESDLPAHYLWRFMIAKEYQGKGYGKRVLDLLVAKCRADNKRSSTRFP